MDRYKVLLSVLIVRWVLITTRWVLFYKKTAISVNQVTRAHKLECSRCKVPKPVKKAIIAGTAPQQSKC